jgi:hypothetical protein
MSAHRLAAAAVCVLLASATLRAADVPSHQNAALQYLIAFEYLPRPGTPEGRLLDDWEAVRFDEAKVETLRRWQTPLKYLHRGAELKDCVWPSALNRARDGINAISPTHHARELAVLGVLRARYRFEHGRPEAAFDDVLAVLKLARHVGQEGGMIPLLIERAVEEQAIRCVARNIGAVKDRELWRNFLRKWDALPKATTLADAIAAERDWHVAWFKTRGVRVGSDPEPDLEGNPPKDDGERVATIKYLLGFQLESGSVREFTTAINREYGRAVEIARLPLDEVRPAAKEWNARLGQNAAGYDRVVWVYITLGTPDVYKLRLGEARRDAGRAMLRAAVAAAAENADVTKTSRDPFGDGPFEVTKTPDGYELRSKLDDLLTGVEKQGRVKPAGRAVLAVRTTRP